MNADLMYVNNTLILDKTLVRSFLLQFVLDQATILPDYYSNGIVPERSKAISQRWCCTPVGRERTTALITRVETLVKNQLYRFNKWEINVKWSIVHITDASYLLT